MSSLGSVSRLRARPPCVRLLPSCSVPHRAVTGLLATVAMLIVGGKLATGEPAKSSAAVAPAAQPSNEELLRNFQCMEQRIRALEAQLKSQTTAPLRETE